MIKPSLAVLGLALAVLIPTGCTTSAQEQRQAELHQLKSDEAADKGQFGLAGQEQREAADSHHVAVKKAIDEGSPIPPQTERGDGRPDAGH